jgi:glyoxylase I family protein
MKWSHVGLNCRDIGSTERFYSTVFGFRRVRTVPLDGDERVVFLRRGDSYLELFAAAGGEPRAASADGPRQAGTIRHLAFQVEDVDAFLAELDGSAPITLGPVDFDTVIPGWRTVWISDPDGVVIEVSQGYRDEATGEQDG